MKESDNLTVIGRKKKERKAPHFKMGGGRKMDELRKMNLGREISSFKMSDHAFPFILLTDFLRLALPKFWWQMKQPMLALLARGARRSIQQGERLEHSTFVSLQWLARRWSLTFTKIGSHQLLIGSGSAVDANGRYERVGSTSSTASTAPFVQGELCHDCVKLEGQKWEHGHGDQDLASARCWGMYLNPSIQQCANSGPTTEVYLRVGSAFPILFLFGWKWENNLLFFLIFA